jgi:hypothetical protein
MHSLPMSRIECASDCMVLGRTEKVEEVSGLKGTIFLVL